MTDDELDQRFAAYAAQNTPAASDTAAPSPGAAVDLPNTAAATAQTTGADPATDDARATAEASGGASEPKETDPPVDEKAELEERLQRQYFEQREAKRLLKLAQQELEVLRGTRKENRDETLAREAEALAGQMATQNAFNAECNRIAKELDKAYGGFAPIVAKFQQTFSSEGIPRPLLEAVIEAGEGQEHKVLHWLSNNLDEAERIQGLPAAKQGVAIARISAKMTAPKPVSNAPPPIRTVGGGSKSSEGPAKDFSKMSTAEQIKFYDEEDRKKRASKYIH